MTPWNGIKSRLFAPWKTFLFRLPLALALALLQPATAANYVNPDTQVFSQHETDVFPAPILDETIPPIEARTYEVKIKREAESGRSFLFEDPTGAKPVVGNIILLKRGTEPVMAFRVLRNQVEKKEFIAKRVRRYGNAFRMPAGEAFTAVERVTELALPPPPTMEDQQDMKELAGDGDADYAANPDAGAGDPGTAGGAGAPSGGGPAPGGTDDATLDGLASNGAAGSGDPALSGGGADEPAGGAGGNGGAGDDGAPDGPPPEGGPVGEADFNLSGESDVSDPGSVTAIDEIDPLDRHRQALSAEFGTFRGAIQPDADTAPYYTGIGLRYGLTLGRMVLVRRAKVQDSFVLEGGAFVYRVNNFLETGDSYTVVPLIATGRYNLFLNETFGIHFYGGIARTVVAGSTDGTTEGLDRLQAFTPAFGGGLLFRLGPHWHARVDAGLDMIGAGLMISF